MRVGLVGCGRIALAAHLPAYKKYNVEVVAVCDVLEDRAEHAAAEYGIVDTYTDATKLAANKNVDIIDIATQPHNRLELLRSLYKFKKPMLIQKPLSYSYTEAQLIANELAQQRILVAINHNARWTPVSQYISNLICHDDLGTIYQIHHVNRFDENLQAWYTDLHDYMFLDHGLHYFDLVRQFSKQAPIAVSALCNKMPGQIARCPLTYAINLRFADNLIASLYFNNAQPSPQAYECVWYIDGTKANVAATIDSVSVHYRSGSILPMTRLEGDWVPEGFWGAYKSFVECIKNGLVPPHSVQDHLETFKIAAAAAKSAAASGAWVEI